MDKNNELLKQFTEPITKFIKNDQSAINNYNARIRSFIEDNKHKKLNEFMENAENEFGIEAKYNERYYNYKNLENINMMVRFFFILSIISIIAGIILGIATIK